MPVLLLGQIHQHFPCQGGLGDLTLRGRGYFMQGCVDKNSLGTAGFWVLGFGFRVLGRGLRVWDLGLGFRV